MWEQKPGIFGYMQPRLIASYGDKGITYKYSGVENVALEIRLIGKDGKPAKGVPSDDSYIEMQLPGALLEGNPKLITINWIDFYR